MENYQQLAERARLQRLGATDPDTFAYSVGVMGRTKTAICQIHDRNETDIYFYCSRLTDGNDEHGEGWLPLRPDLPAWLPIGVPFTVQMLADVMDWDDLQNTPWAIRTITFDVTPTLPDQDFDAWSSLDTPPIARGTIQLDWVVARRAVAEIAMATAFDTPVPEWVVDVAPDWQARIRRAHQASGKHYPLLTAFEDECWLPDGIKIEWLNRTVAKAGSHYFSPELPSLICYVVGTGKDADAPGAGEQVFCCNVATSQTFVLPAKAFEARFLPLECRFDSTPQSVRELDSKQEQAPCQVNGDREF